MPQSIRVAGSDEIPDGEAIVVSTDLTGESDSIAVFHSEGEYFALDDTCTHEDASLADGWIEGDEVECPIHSAKFCLRTGAALCLPATLGARTHLVEKREDGIWLTPGLSGAQAGELGNG